MDTLIRILSIPEVGALLVIGVALMTLVVLGLFRHQKNYMQCQTMCIPSRVGNLTGEYQQTGQQDQRAPGQFDDVNDWLNSPESGPLTDERIRRETEGMSPEEKEDYVDSKYGEYKRQEHRKLSGKGN